MIARQKLAPPVSQRRVVEQKTRHGWSVVVAASDLREARRLVNSLTTEGCEARSRVDPRSTVSAEQLDVLHELREKLPSRWRQATRQLWNRPHGRTLVTLILKVDQVDVLRRMKRTHGARWLRDFWFVWE